MIQASCPFCRQLCETEDDQAGQRVACPACQKKFVMPKDPVGIPVPQVTPPIAEPDPLAFLNAPRQPQRQHATGFTCPYCHATRRPVAISRISTAGWVLFVVLLFFCFPLCWIGLLITEADTRCTACGIKLG